MSEVIKHPENKRPENNLLDSAADAITAKELEELAGEKLDGSGFENEIPESDWR